MLPADCAPARPRGCALDRLARPGARSGDVLSPRLAALRVPLLVAWLLAAALAWLAFFRGADPNRVRLGLFLATLAVELLAFAAALAGRRVLAGDDPTRPAFSAIALGLGLRLVAELRLALIYLSAVPSVIQDSPVLTDIFFLGLRYLYIAADLALLVGFLRTLRGLRSTGLGFHPRPRDLLLLLLLVPLPLAVYAIQTALAPGPVDGNIATFRLLAASVGALVSGVCVVLASAALQMGGGAWAWIWGAAALAGLARALAFVAAAAAAVLPSSGALVLEQALLWTFACAWLLATLLHRRLVRPA